VSNAIATQPGPIIEERILRELRLLLHCNSRGRHRTKSPPGCLNIQPGRLTRSGA
jgi:hypothetical protein